MNPALVSTWGTPKKFLDVFLKSAKIHGLHPHNSDPGDWPSRDDWWRKNLAQARFVSDHASEYTHFMFTDSLDVVFAAGWDEIIPKFEKLNSPIVFASECYCWPDTGQANLYPEVPHRCRFLNAGFWMATSEAALSFTKELSNIAKGGPKCDQGIVVDMFLSKKYPIVLDTACSICFCMNMNSPEYLNMDGPRPITTDTKEQPCMFHGNSGVSIHSIIAKVCP
jgi:hypothetical protein